MEDFVALYKFPRIEIKCSDMSVNMFCFGQLATVGREAKVDTETTHKSFISCFCPGVLMSAMALWKTWCLQLLYGSIWGNKAYTYEGFYIQDSDVSSPSRVIYVIHMGFPSFSICLCQPVWLQRSSFWVIISVHGYVIYLAATHLSIYLKMYGFTVVIFMWVTVMSPISLVHWWAAALGERERERVCAFVVLSQLSFLVLDTSCHVRLGQKM